jgi:hypothetical protein
VIAAASRRAVASQRVAWQRCEDPTTGMASGEFQLGDVFTGEEFDEAAARREAGRFLERWTGDDFATAAAWTRRLAILGSVGIPVAALLPTVSELTDLILEVTFYAFLLGAGAAASTYYLFRDVDRPADVLEADLDAIETGGLLVALVFAYSATNARAGRLAWRFVFRSATFAPGGRPPRLEDDDSGAYLTWMRPDSGHGSRRRRRRPGVVPRHANTRRARHLRLPGRRRPWRLEHPVGGRPRRRWNWSRCTASCSSSVSSSR